MRGALGRTEHARTGSTLARVGYAAAGTLVAVLVSWLVSIVPWPADAQMPSLFVSDAAMGAVLMLWASFKPSRGSAGTVAGEALVILAVAMAVQMIDSHLQTPGMIGLYSSPALWMWDHVVFLLYSGLGFVLPAAWALGSNERWARRSPKRVVCEFGFAMAAVLLAAFDPFDLSRTLLGFMVQGFFFVAAALAFAAVLQRAVCGIVWRSREEREPVVQPQPRHAPPEPPCPRRRLRTLSVVMLALAFAASATTLALFFGCAAYAQANGLQLRNVVYGVPSICVLLTAFVVVPFAAIEGATGEPKDYRIAGYAVLGGLVLLVVMFPATFRLEAPEEIVQDDGVIEVVTPVWLDKDRVTYADAEGPLFRRERPDPDAGTRRSDESSDGALAPRQGCSYHNTGVITAVDVEARTLELAITQSTEDFETGARVRVDCSSAEHFDVPFEQLAVGDSVQIRSTEAQANGTVVAQRVFATTGGAEAQVEAAAVASEGDAESESLDDVLEELSCSFTVSGTVTSAIGENGFEFRIDDGGGVIENGTELYVSTLFVERRLYGMKGLQWGMDGVIIGFSDLPAEDVLRAKVIVGNDDTSSEYWENMQIVH